MRNLFVAFIALVASTAAQAGDIVAHVGAYSPIRDTTPSSESALGGLEYRMNDVYAGLRPTVGGFGTLDGSAYAYVGANWDLPIRSIEPFVITPGAFIGGYHQGAGKDLGSGFEFREALEVSYQFPTKQRLGVAISHLSNAGTGSINPGVETLEAIYSFPL